MSSVEITPKQRRVLDRLLNGESIANAAQMESISERQVYRWLRQDNDFRATLRAAQGVMLDSVGVRLVKLAEKAVEVLQDLLESRPARNDTPGANAQLRAALGVIEGCLKWRETVDFEERLSEMEAIANEYKRERETP